MLSVSVFIYLYFPQQYREQEFAAAKSEAKIISEMTAYSIAPTMAQHDSFGIKEVLTSIQKNSDIPFIIITNTQDKIIDGYNVNMGLHIMDSEIDAVGKLTEDNATYISKSPIRFNDVTVGYIYLGLSLDSIFEQVKETKRNISLISFIIISIGLAGVYFATRLLLEPLETMGNTFHKIAQGDFSRRAQISSYAEVNKLADSFNRMVDGLEDAQKELQSINHTLETRVDERTQDLQRAIQQHKRTEEALRDSEERYRGLVDLSPDAIVVLSNGRFIFINPSALTLFGVDNPDEAMNRSLFDFMKHSSTKLLEGSLHQILDGSVENILSEYIFVRLDGSEFIAEVAASKLVFRGEMGIQIVIRDISERIKNERQRMDLEQQLLHVQKKEIISTLASGLAHDILNILGIIGTSINKLLFMKNFSKESLMESAEQISKASERGKSLVRQLLSFARKSELNFSLIQMNTVITEILSILERTFPSQIHIETSLDPNLPMIRADQNQLHQAFLNLCLNARDAISKDGVISIETTLVKHAEMGKKIMDVSEHICVIVTDNGIGMKKEIIDRIYEPFFTTKSEGAGSGLGMAMVKGILENHRGCIEVDSTVGEGTTFKLFFPL